MPPEIIKVVIDTNIWLSYLLTGSFQELDELILRNKISLQISEELITEIYDVVKRPKFHNLLNDDDITILLDLFKRKAELIRVTSKLNNCRDKKDNYLLNLAVDAGADYLITGDKDLLDLKKIKETKM